MAPAGSMSFNAALRIQDSAAGEKRPSRAARPAKDAQSARRASLYKAGDAPFK
jgi:hypothetical protein